MANVCDCVPTDFSRLLDGSNVPVSIWRRAEMPFILGQVNVLEVKLQQPKSPSTFVQGALCGQGWLE